MKSFQTPAIVNPGLTSFVSIARCGGTIHVSRYGNTHIRSPNYPSPYGSDQFDCEWNVVGPTGHFLTFSFPEIRLPTTMNCSQTDFVQIKDSPDMGTLIIQIVNNFKVPGIILPDIRSLNFYNYFIHLDPVNCGGRRQADSCAECAAGFSSYGQYYCNGDCQWQESSSSCTMSDEAIERRGS